MSGEKHSLFQNLTTERLVLRRLLHDDADQIYKLRSDEGVNKYLGRSACKSIDDASAFIKSILESKAIYWGITFTDDNKLIGTICLFEFSEDGSKAEIGYELLPEFQGRGLMKEAMCAVIDFAFKDLGVGSIEAFTHPENFGSSRLLDGFGFKKQEGEGGDLLRYELTPED